MVARRVIPLVVVAGLLGWWLYAKLRPDDEARIRRAFDELCDAASFSEREAPLTAVGNARTMGPYFAQDVHIGTDVLPYSINSRRELESMVVRARTSLDSLAIDRKEQVIELVPGHQEATMRVFARANLAGRGQRESVWKEVTMRWVRTDDDWQIAEVNAADTIIQPE